MPRLPLPSSPRPLTRLHRVLTLAFCVSGVTAAACGSSGDTPSDGGDGGVDGATDGATMTDASRGDGSTDGATTTDAGRTDGATADATTTDAAPLDAGADARTDGAADAASDTGARDTGTGTDGSSSNPDLDPPATCSGRPALKLTWFPANGITFDQPMMLAQPRGDATRTFVVERGGKIKLVKSGAVQATAFLDITSLVDSATNGEAGLIGFVLHPGYAQNGRFFVYYTTKTDNHTTLVEYARSGANEDVADTNVVRTFFTIANDQVQQGNHNGGSLAFGPDGYLYVSVGDGGNQGDPDNYAQSLGVKLGKILRYDVDAPTVPPTGNMTGNGVDTAIWAYGLRNPWRTSFDRKTGDLYIGDVGYASREEIDVNPAGVGGLNFGWRCMEGNLVRNVSGCPTTGFTAPAVDHVRSEATSIIGGHVYRGQAIPCLRGRYIYGDYGTDEIYSFVWNGSAATSKETITGDLNPGGSLALSPLSFGEDANGELYVLLATGRIYRIDAE